MYQQINLYQPVFRKQSKIFSVTTLLQMLAVITLLLVGVYAHSSWKLNGLEHMAGSLEAQYRQLEAQLVAIEGSQASAETSPLESEISTLQRNIAKRHELLEKFERVEMKHSTGFGGFFKLLAQQTLPGLWITGIRLTHDGKTELQGSALNSALVPRYLQRMPDLPRFRALQQGSVHLARDGSGNPEIDFILRSRKPENPR